MRYSIDVRQFLSTNALQGFLPVVQCVLSKRYGITGWSVNTAGGVITPDTIKALVPLIEAGIR